MDVTVYINLSLPLWKYLLFSPILSNRDTIYLLIRYSKPVMMASIYVLWIVFIYYCEGDKDGRFSGTKLNLTEISVNRVVPDDPNAEWLSSMRVVSRIALVSDPTRTIFQTKFLYIAMRTALCGKLM